MNHHNRARKRLAASCAEQASRHARMVRDFLVRGWISPARADAIEAFRCARKALELDRDVQPYRG